MLRQAAAGRPGRRGQPQAQAAPPEEASQEARCCTAGSCGGGGTDALHSKVPAHEISARHRHGTCSEAAWAWRCTGAPGTGQRCTGRCAAPDSCASKGTPGSGTPAACRESHSGRTEGTAAGHCALAPGVVGSHAAAQRGKVGTVPHIAQQNAAKPVDKEVSWVTATELPGRAKTRSPQVHERKK